MLSPAYKALTIAVCFICLMLAAVWDWHTRSIPNKITFPLMIFGFLLTCFYVPATLIFKILFIIALFFFGRLGWVGLGDIKLIMGLGMAWEPLYALYTVALASLLVFVRHFIKAPIMTQIQALSGLSIFHKRKALPAATADNSIAFAPYLLAAYILLQGGALIWQHFFAA